MVFSKALGLCRILSTKPLVNLETATRLISSTPKKSDYDAVIVGGGHNGLVAAAYLSKCGVKTCVLERRHVLGGAAVTEEIVPGFKFSRASYVLSLLRPQIFKDLELKRHGLKVYLRQPSSYTPLQQSCWKNGGPTSLTLGMDHEQNKKQIGQFSTLDSERFEEYEAQLCRFVDAVDPLLDHSPPDIHGDAGLLAKLQQVRPLFLAATKLGKEADQFYEMMTAPTTKILNKWFESEPLIATLATDACIGAMISPATPGSGYVLLHHVMGELEGIRGAWGYPEGGMGSVSDAIAKSAEEAGADIVTDAPVKEILLGNDGQAVGVKLENGTDIKSKVVLSNATPQRTFLELLDSTALSEDFRSAVQNVDYTSPVTKINVAVDKLPNFLADPNIKENEVMPHHRCTIHMNCENTSLLQSAYDDAATNGTYSCKPMIELTIPSSLDPTLAPPGKHVCLFFTQYTPYTLSSGQSWEDEQTREEYANVIFDTVEEYAPGFKASIVGKEVLPPPILEKTFGLTGGNIFHGAMALDQLYVTRPVAQKGVSPGTPLQGLYLCGSGAHPGGGVMGAPGRLAAKAVAQKISKWKFS